MGVNAQIDVIAIATSAAVEVETVIATSVGVAKIEIGIATATSASHARRPKKLAITSPLLSRLRAPKAVVVKDRDKAKDAVVDVTINAVASRATTIVASVSPPPLLPSRAQRRRRLQHRLSHHQHRLRLRPTQR